MPGRCRRAAPGAVYSHGAAGFQGAALPNFFSLRAGAPKGDPGEARTDAIAAGAGARAEARRRAEGTAPTMELLSRTCR
jgi:hypothetical protein